MTPLEIAPFKKLDPKTQYADCFHNWMQDLNGDGWLDQIVIGMPGEKAVWRENPGFPSPPNPLSPKGRGGVLQRQTAVHHQGLPRDVRRFPARQE